MKSTVSEKGQVTIPKALRDTLGLTAGTMLEFKAANGQLIAQKLLPRDVIAKWRGRARLPGNVSVDEYLKQTRDADGD